MTKTRKKRVSYQQVEAGLNPMRDWAQEWYRYVSPEMYIRECKEATGLADWKIAKDLGIDSGCEVTAATVRNWRVRGEKNG